MKRLLAALAMTMAPTLGWAQQACPVPVTINNLGVASWLDADSVISNLSSQRAWIDVEYRDASSGMLVGYVEPGSPADQAGLTAGSVITQINNVDVTDTAARDELLMSLKSGDVLRMQARIGGVRSLINVPASGVDPLPALMAGMLEEQDCLTATAVNVTNNVALSIEDLIFDDERNLNCSDAHVALEELGERSEMNDVYMIRNNTNILITMPYWGTTCVPASSLDGRNLQPSLVMGILNNVIGGYVQDQTGN